MLAWIKVAAAVTEKCSFNESTFQVAPWDVGHEGKGATVRC